MADLKPVEQMDAEELRREIAIGSCVDNYIAYSKWALGIAGGDRNVKLAICRAWLTWKRGQEGEG